MQTQDAPRLFDHLRLRSDGNMKQDTATDKCIIDHHVKHKLSQVLINLTQDTRPRANSPGKKRKGTDRKRLEVATRKGTVFHVSLGYCWEDSGCSLLRLPLLMQSLILSSCFLLPFILSPSLFSAAIFSYCRFPGCSPLFLSSFRFWGVFHKGYLRSPPLADLALPYRSRSRV